jgi:hypothetical protein
MDSAIWQLCILTDEYNILQSAETIDEYRKRINLATEVSPVFHIHGMTERTPKALANAIPVPVDCHRDFVPRAKVGN